MINVRYVEDTRVLKMISRHHKQTELRKSLADPPIVEDSLPVTVENAELFKRAQVANFTKAKKNSFFAQLRLRKRQRRIETKSEATQNRISTLGRNVKEFISGATSKVVQCLVTGDPFDYETTPIDLRSVKEREHSHRLIQRLEERKHLPLDIVGSLNVISRCHDQKITSKQELTTLIGAQNILISNNFSLTVPETDRIVSPSILLDAISTKFNVSLNYLKGLKPRDNSLYEVGGRPHLFCKHSSPT